MERWYWIELIGFDNTLPDYGAEEFLSRTGGADGVSLLFSSADFVCAHKGGSGEYFLKPCDCSYGAQRYSELRERQAWTNIQLKGLVSALHKHSVKVLMSFFNLFAYNNDDGELELGDFCGAHKELWETAKDGSPTYCLNVLSRFSDGSYFEDFLIKKAIETADYYGFDGIQAADGISSFRYAVQNGNMSDDMVEQFVIHFGYSETALAPCGNSKAKHLERRDYILDSKYAKWLEFISVRFAGLYQKFADAAKGRLLMFNSCWTRDPFEAYIRYGIDYSIMPMRDVYAIMVEEVSATCPIFSPEDRGGFYLPEKQQADFPHEFYLMQQSIKICNPHLKQITLTQVRDTFEQWDIMRHAPTEQERAIMRRNNSVVLHNGKYINCSGGPLYCLSGDATAEDWAYLNGKENMSASVPVYEPLGFLAVWSDAGLRAEAEYYLDTHDYTRTAINNALLSEGLSIDGAVKATEIDDVKNAPLLAVNVNFYTPQEIAALESTSLRMAVIGKVNPLKKKAEKHIETAVFGVWLYNFGDAAQHMPEIKPGAVKSCKAGYSQLQGGIWTAPLKYDSIGVLTLKKIATALNVAAGLPIELSRYGQCVLTTFDLGGGRYRMLISNKSSTYHIARVKMPLDFKSVRSLSKFGGYKVIREGRVFYDRIVPRGMDIVEIEV